MTCSSLSSCAANSWSTGSTASVNSHYLRLKAAGAKKLVGYNDAVSGAMSGALNAQAQKAVSQQAQYVTIEIGANDACTSTVTAMTPTDDLQGERPSRPHDLGGDPERTAAGLRGQRPEPAAPLRRQSRALQRPADVGPAEHLPVHARQPEQHRTRSTSTGAPPCRRGWTNTTPPSQSCAPSPRTTAAMTEAPSRARQFAAADISTRDYFHPSLAGQTKLAAVTWPTTQWVTP